MKKVGLMVMLFLISYCSYAQEWKLLDKVEGTSYYMRVHSENSAWFKIEHDKPVKEEQIFSKDWMVKKELSLYRFNCQKKKMGLMARVVYDEDGEVLDNNDISDVSVEMKHVIPETVGEFLFKKFCKKSK